MMLPDYYYYYYYYYYFYYYYYYYQVLQQSLGRWCSWVDSDLRLG